MNGFMKLAVLGAMLFALSSLHGIYQSVQDAGGFWLPEGESCVPDSVYVECIYANSWGVLTMGEPKRLLVDIVCAAVWIPIFFLGVVIELVKCLRG